MSTEKIYEALLQDQLGIWADFFTHSSEEVGIHPVSVRTEKSASTLALHNKKQVLQILQPEIA